VLSLRPESRVQQRESERIRATRIAQPRLRVNDNLVDVNFTVLVEDSATSAVKRFEETHTMRDLFLPEVAFLLEKAGMQRACAREWLSSGESSAQSWSAVVVARKSRE
jgi:hypothetical protein